MTAKCLSLPLAALLVLSSPAGAEPPPNEWAPSNGARSPGGAGTCRSATRRR